MKTPIILLPLALLMFCRGTDSDSTIITRCDSMVCPESMPLDTLCHRLAKCYVARDYAGFVSLFPTTFQNVQPSVWLCG